MDNSSEKQVLLVGLPEAGKTSFVAALWHVLTAEDVAGALKLSSLSGDDAYLNQILEAWITYKAVLRTTQQDEKMPTFHLEDEATGNRCTLVVPDLSGETFRRQWVDREWSEAFDQTIRGCNSLLVFIHPNQKMEAVEITPAMRLLPEAIRQEVAAEQTEAEPWDPERAAGVVQLVDVLQFLGKVVPRPVRTAIVISAWDLLEEHFTGPQDYVSRRLPLLEQFLETNSDTFTSETFGLSALGVAIDDADRTQELQQNVASASERIKVVRGTLVSHDITLPLRWSLEWEREESRAG